VPFSALNHGPKVVSAPLLPLVPLPAVLRPAAIAPPAPTVTVSEALMMSVAEALLFRYPTDGIRVRFIAAPPPPQPPLRFVPPLPQQPAPPPPPPPRPRR